MRIFLSTLSLRRATAGDSGVAVCKLISIHALLAESDKALLKIQQQLLIFLSTLSLRRATVRLPNKLSHSPLFLSTLSLRRATFKQDIVMSMLDISIHALLAESDRVNVVFVQKGRNFYPRSPCGERPAALCTACIPSLFLSTLSLRRATLHGSHAWRC